MNIELILLHGALGCKKQFEDLQKILSEKRKVHALDFDGHGENHSDKDFSMELFSENILDFLNENNIEKADVFGYSMGGYAALCLAKKHPQRLGKIMTLGTKFHWDKETAENETKKLDPEKIEEKVPAFAKHLTTLHPANPWKNVVRKTAALMHGLGNENHLTAEDLKKISNETLICLGSLDAMVTIEESETVAKMLPNAEFKLIEGFQHPIERIDVGGLAGFVDDFF